MAGLLEIHKERSDVLCKFLEHTRFLLYLATCPLGLSWLRSICHGLAISCVLAFCQASYSQSTFGTVLGTVKDPSGSLVPMAKVNLMNTGTNAERTAITNTERIV